MSFVAGVVVLGARQTRQAATDAVAIDKDDIGGVVTGPKGPEAGVWVIAETADLGTKFVRIVVTDDRGRYLIPDLPGVKYSVWVRGYGLVDSAKVAAQPGRALNLTAVPAPDAARGRRVLPGRLLVFAAPGAAEERFPGNGGVRQRHRRQHHQSGAVAANHQVGRLHGVPPARHQGHARDAGGLCRARLVVRGLAATAAIRSGGEPDDLWHRRSWA